MNLKIDLTQLSTAALESMQADIEAELAVRYEDAIRHEVEQIEAEFAQMRAEETPEGNAHAKALAQAIREGLSPEAVARKIQDTIHEIGRQSGYDHDPEAAARARRDLANG